MKHLPAFLRRLLRSPGFTGLAVFTLAVAIGANAAIFSVVWGVLLRPLPFPDPDRLVGVWSHAPALDVAEKVPQAEESYVLLRDRARSFESVALLDDMEVTLTGRDQPRRLQAARVTASTFHVLGGTPLLGRVFNEDDDEPGSPAIAVLSQGLWSRAFGSDPFIVGRTIELDGSPVEVVGVMPAGFRDVFQGTELWTPFRIDESRLPRVSYSYPMIGRLAEGATIASASREVDALELQIPEVYPEGLTARMLEDAHWSADVNPLQEDIVGDLARTLWILVGAVGFVLLIACANVANLFLVRAEARHREMALRAALGAGRDRVVRHVLSESLTLGLVSGVVGLLLAWGGVHAVLALSPDRLPRADGVGLSWPVVGFTALLSVVAGLLFGAAPLVKYLRLDLSGGLKEGGRGGSDGRGSQRLRFVLVAGQVALAAVLLVSSGLLLRSFQRLRHVDPGFRASGVLTFSLSLPESRYGDGDARERFWEALEDRLRELPGVTTVGSAGYLPLTDGENNSVLVVEDFPPEPGALPEVVRTVLVGPGYFQAMGIDLLEGRLPTRQDLRDGRNAVLLSRSFATRLWGAESPIGKRVSPNLPSEQTGDDWVTVIGVVDDVHDTSLQVEADEEVYFLRSNVNGEGQRDTESHMVFTLATRGSPGALVEPVRQAVWSMDPDLPLVSMRDVSDIVRAAMASMTYTMILVGVAAGVALLLGSVGLYGIIAYVVSRRTREIGVRMALGAGASTIVSMVVRQGLVVSAVGVVLGMGGAVLLTRLLESLLFGVSATDPETFLAASLLLLAVTLVSTAMPAWRASRVQPSDALRAE